MGHSPVLVSSSPYIDIVPNASYCRHKLHRNWSPFYCRASSYIYISISKNVQFKIAVYISNMSGKLHCVYEWHWIGGSHFPLLLYHDDRDQPSDVHCPLAGIKDHDRRQATCAEKPPTDTSSQAS